MLKVTGRNLLEENIFGYACTLRRATKARSNKKQQQTTVYSSIVRRPVYIFLSTDSFSHYFLLIHWKNIKKITLAVII